jgi:predicted SAM-dependent methyltransferase
MFKNIIKKLVHNLGYKIMPLAAFKKPEVSNPEDIERLRKVSLSGEPILLHFGCGPRVLKNWINIDLAFEPYEYYLQFYGDEFYPESIRGNKKDLFEINIIRDGIPLPDNSVDGIFHEDFFEHLVQRDQIIFLAETLRVLKPGSVHRINTPNLSASMRDYSDFKKGKDGVYTDEWNQWEHFSVINPGILEEMAKMTGYSEVKFTERNKSSIAHLLPKEYRPNPTDRAAKDANVFADLFK